MSFFDGLGDVFKDASDGISGKNQKDAFNQQQAQQNKILDLEQQRIAAVVSAGQGSPANVGLIIGISLIGAIVIVVLVYLSTRHKTV